MSNRPTLVSSLALAAIVLAVAVPAVADAPRDPPQYAQFDRDALEITDKFTGLVWDRRRVSKGIDQASAQLNCSASVFPGVGRLPSVKELLTLIDEDPHQEYDTSFKPPLVLKSIDQLAFPDTPTDQPYWTSTPAGAGKFWTVDFTTGKTDTRDGSVSTKANARCVR